MILIAEALLLEPIAWSGSPLAADPWGRGVRQRQDATMTAPSDQFYPGEDGQGRYPALEAMDRDLDRLGELTRGYVTDEKEDLGVAAARIPDLDLRREAEELLRRLKEAIGADPEGLDAISETLAEPGTGPLPVLHRPSCFAGAARVIVSR
jgi:hypothetical protein